MNQHTLASSAAQPVAAPVSHAWKAFNGTSTKGVLGKVLALEDFEPLARARLPRCIYGYVAGASETRQSWRDNCQAFEHWGFVTRVLRNVAERSQATRLLGRTWASPFGIAPMGLAALSAYQGDRVLAQAAAQANIPFVISGTALTPLEALVRAAPHSWFQAYLPGEQARIDALVDRVRAAGVETLVVTVDIPVAGNRENNIRTGFSTPLRPSLGLAWDGLSHPRWLLGTFLRTLANGMPHFENSFAERGAPVVSRHVERDFSRREHLDWGHIERIRQRWPGHLVIKGILDVRDARLAVDSGADGIIVSNHGGRQLDGTVPPLRVLPGIVQACPEVPVMIDSGFRRGTDVLKAVALGAKFVFVGRPFNYAASVAGEDGVRKAIGLLREEVSRNMAMLGVNGLSELDASYLLPAHPVS